MDDGPKKDPFRTFGASWWGAPGIAGLVLGIAGLVLGRSVVWSLVCIGAGLSLSWSAYKHIKRYGRWF